MRRHVIVSANVTISHDTVVENDGAAFARRSAGRHGPRRRGSLPGNGSSGHTEYFGWRMGTIRSARRGASRCARRSSRGGTACATDGRSVAATKSRSYVIGSLSGLSPWPLLFRLANFRGIRDRRGELRRHEFRQVDARKIGPLAAGGKQVERRLKSVGRDTRACAEWRARKCSRPSRRAARPCPEIHAGWPARRPAGRDGSVVGPWRFLAPAPARFLSARRPCAAKPLRRGFVARIASRLLPSID